MTMSTTWFDALAQDMRYAIRAVTNGRGVAIVSVVTIALGAGANTAMFQLLNAVQWRTLPLDDPQRLVEVRVDDMTHARGAWLREPSLTNPLWEQIRPKRDVLSGSAAWADEQLDVSTGQQMRNATALWVSGDFFRVLGVQPFRGRLIEAADDRRGCGASTVVLSYGFWQREFGADPAVVGRSAAIGMMHPTIVGVAPPSFYGLEVGRTFDLAVPICAEPAWHGVDARLDSGMVWWLTVIGRLKPGVDVREAAAALREQSAGVFEATLPANYPPASIVPYRSMRLVLLPAAHGWSRLREQYTPSLRLLLAMTTVVLMIACVNLAHLMRARAAHRMRELAIHWSIGASALRLGRQLLAECAVLAAAGLALGLIVAGVLCRLLLSLLAADGTSIALELSPDWHTFAFLAAIAAATIVIASSVPVRDILRSGPAAALVPGRRPAASGDSIGIRRALLASQISLSFVLLVAAAMFVRSLHNLDVFWPGFHTRDVIVADLAFSELQRPSAQAIALRQSLLEHLRRNPSVAAASETLILPITGGNWNSRMWIDGADPRTAQAVMRNMIGTDYFRTLGTPVVSGREFTERDMAAGAPNAAIVNERFLRRFQLGSPGVGRRVRIETNALEPEASYEIVGVVANTKYHDLREDDQPIVYVPLSQAALRRPSGRILVRAADGAGHRLASVGTELGAARVRYSLRPYDTLVGNTVIRERLMAALAIPFGILAALLCAVGQYGVFSDAVARRTRELGIRIALGATRGHVVRSMMHETARVLAIGLPVGGLLVVWASRTVSGLLFEIAPYDAATLAVVGMSIALIAGLATYGPARRAAQADPILALRAE